MKRLRRYKVMVAFVAWRVRNIRTGDVLLADILE